MDKIVDHLFVFKGNGLIEDFPGNYSDYRAYEDSQEQEKSSSNEEKKIKKKWKEKSTKKTLTYEQQKEFKKLEREIQKIETQKKEIQNRFTTESLDPKEIEEYSIKLGTLEQALDQKTERWFELSALKE
jgi:ATP-binding cassette subfamily F protein uup